MKYWDEMNDVFGFDCGDRRPPGVELFRDVYLKTVNRLAERWKSDFRVVPFNYRSHNRWLWMIVPKEWFENVFLGHCHWHRSSIVWQGVEFKDLPDKQNGQYPEPKPDLGLSNAIAEARKLDLDSFVQVLPVVNENFMVSVA